MVDKSRVWGKPIAGHPFYTAIESWQFNFRQKLDSELSAAIRAGGNLNKCETAYNCLKALHGAYFSAVLYLADFAGDREFQRFDCRTYEFRIWYFLFDLSLTWNEAITTTRPVHHWLRTMSPRSPNGWCSEQYLSYAEMLLEAGARISLPVVRKSSCTCDRRLAGPFHSPYLTGFFEVPYLREVRAIQEAAAERTNRIDGFDDFLPEMQFVIDELIPNCLVSTEDVSDFQMRDDRQSDDVHWERRMELIMLENPNIAVTELALLLGISRQHLYKNPRFQQLHGIQKSDRWQFQAKSAAKLTNSGEPSKESGDWQTAIDNKIDAEQRRSMQ